MRDSGEIIVNTSNAIIEILDSCADLENKHRSGSCLRALMVYYIRAGFGFDDFKEVINNPIIENCYNVEVENENN